MGYLVRFANTSLTTGSAEKTLGVGSMRTFPVKVSAGPFMEGCEPFRLILMASALAVNQLVHLGPRRYFSAGVQFD